MTVKQSATAYFQTLASLVLTTHITEQDGTVLALDEGFRRAVELIISVQAASGKAMVIGNGGSAAIASHTQNDLCKAVGLRAVGFYETPLLTALSNDYGYETVFERQVDFWADSGDLLIAISSSGQSENILQAVKMAKTRGCSIITLSGFHSENTLRCLGNLNFYIAADTYGYVEAAHAVLAHFLTDSALECNEPSTLVKDDTNAS
ncbi:SIS domain-containing protein [candidate division KSB3 bacterium]|uniref:SIS domain-containing protein n=1 Tax=candidate division KSB3 bacterium TaxID=2044937 RepID=A0A9D5Q807_9BACT|nr:SIS domain-containing protein [candidate division KSB3 bacterium]MBD3326847.1 SIS domain-containing protein [candidate division KSB3 bacterium]